MGRTKIFLSFARNVVKKSSYPEDISSAQDRLASRSRYALTSTSLAWVTPFPVYAGRVGSLSTTEAKCEPHPTELLKRNITTLPVLPIPSVVCP